MRGGGQLREAKTRVMYRRALRKFVPRSGSKRSQEGFARDKPSETSREEIKDANRRVSSDFVSSRPRGRGQEGGR